MRGAGIYGGTTPALVDPRVLAALIEQRTADLEAARASVDARYRALELHQAGEAARAASAGQVPEHHCGEAARYIHTYEEYTGDGRAVWLLYECKTCGRIWDVLSDDS